MDNGPRLQPTALPKSNGSWAQEISLDLDMVSAICHILLVGATSNSNATLGIAVNAAAKLGANAINHSYGGSESSSDLSYYNHPGVAITANSGDSAYGAQYPAGSQYVTAVGDTNLAKASNPRGWSETAWSSAGSSARRVT